MGKQSRAKALKRTIRQGVTPEMRASGQLPPWTPWVKLPEIDLDDPVLRAQFEAQVSQLVEASGMSREEAWANMRHRLAIPHYQNSRYHVAIDQLPGQEVLHLDIRTRDKMVPGPERWRDFQRIKNELVGPEYEAVELYPSEARLRDAGNNQHLWVLPKGRRFDFGFTSRIVNYTDSPINRQAPLETDVEVVTPAS